MNYLTLSCLCSDWLPVWERWTGYLRKCRGMGEGGGEGEKGEGGGTGRGIALYPLT